MMSKPTNDANVAAPYAPAAPLPPSNPRLWRKVPSARGPKFRAYALGSKAVVEEITGNKLEKAQTWTWQIIKFGAAKPAQALTREKAMRAAEFLLGLGEMEVEK